MQTADLPFFQASLDCQKDLLLFSIDRAYSYRTFNTAFRSATSFAYGTEVKYGMNLFESITKESDRDKARVNCDRAFSGETHHTVEQYGTIHPAIYETFYNPIHSDAGDIIGVTVCSSNVTARVLAEKRVTTLTKELESFTYTAAHDLRVPLRVIHGYSKILSEDYKSALDDEGRKLVGIISTQASHMGRLIDDLLTFAQLGRTIVTPRKTNLRDVAQQAIDEQVLLYPNSNTKFTIGDLPTANCDPSLVRIVFSNLISNAVKFSSKTALPIIDIGSTTEKGVVTYYVRDNGVGFNMEYSGKTLWIVPATSQTGGIRGNRRRVGHRSEDCGEARW
ncbi:MAG: histidine kinase dimerization/phospho-acceptor domain-containing protein [Bacteroidota bacterium]